LQYGPGGGVTAARAKHGAMTEHQTSRTLVKSAPELWAECSDAASLARHLGAFGEIRITKLEPETAVAWEGAAVRGTVRLEPSGWGTRVTLTMTEPETEAEPDVGVASDAEVAGVADAAGVAGAADAPEVAEVPGVADAGVSELPAEAWGAAVPVAAAADLDAEAEVESAAEPEPAAPRPRRLARLLLALRRKPAADTMPEAVMARDVTPAEGMAADPPVAYVPAADPPVGRPLAVPAGGDALAAALDSLGRAHHRPYSRS